MKLAGKPSGLVRDDCPDGKKGDLAPILWIDGPFILIAEGSADGGEELYPNGIDVTTGLPMLRIDTVTVAKIAMGTTESLERQALQRSKERSQEDHF